MSTQMKGLGKGLSALMAEDYSHEIGENSSSTQHNAITELPVNALASGQFQPRQFFDDTYLKELADSIRSNGVMQPILVRKLDVKKNGASYEIVAGERRWRASKLAGLQKIPVIIKELEDGKALELALIENIQRQDLNALEEAEGYQQLMQRFNYTQETLSKMVGKSRSHVANALRLLGLPDKVKKCLQEGVITFGHARALLMAESPDQLVDKVVNEQLNVRQTEALVKNDTIETAHPITKPSNSSAGNAQNKSHQTNTTRYETNTNKDPDIAALEEALSKHIGLAVDINDNEGVGTISLHYKTLGQLDDILRKLGGAI